MFNNNVPHILDDSFAVWTIEAESAYIRPKFFRTNLYRRDSKRSEIDLHINEWIIADRKKTKAIIDFGIRVYNVRRYSAIGFFIPFSLDDSEIEDLTMMLGQKCIADGMFNTNCKITKNWDTEVLALDYNQHSSNAATLPRKLVKPSVGTGTEVYFDLRPIINHITRDEFYIRFRVPHKTLSNLLNQKNQISRAYGSLITSPILKVNYTYFIRINEMRTVPNDFQYKSDIQNQKINKVIVTMSLNGDLNVNSDSCYKLRILEKNLFKDYTPPKFQLENCISYQWLSEKALKTHYSFALNFFKDTIKLRSLLIYVVFVVLLSALSSCIFTFISNK